MQNSTVLMSSPEYFRIEYSINPWMVEGVEVNLELAKDQWSGLKSTIEKCGAEVKVIPGNTVYPDLVFTANSGIIKDKSVLISNFKFQERQGEEIIYENWFKKNGYDVARIPSEHKFEGRGDAFVYGEYLIGSYGVRSDKEALIYIAEQFELKPKIVKLVDEKFYHLDTCFQYLPTNNNDAIFYPEAFEDSSLKEFSYLTILKFSFGIIFSISFLGAGKSIVLRKKIIPKITPNPIIDLITSPMILALPELVFLMNCIYF